ncbi:MAG: transposase [Arcicella sp.]|nr:transposase [Arcicella sp.]
MEIGYYRKRFKIETLFKDFKSEGFNLHKSKMTDPERLNRLIIICALAYLWLTGMGVAIFTKKSRLKRVYKVQKDTLNLFTHGKRLYKYLIKNDLPVPDTFKIFDLIKV